MKDLSIGHPGKVLLAFTLPLFGSVIFQQLYNIADSFVAGRYIGTSALAAVGNSYEITLIYIALAMGMNIGASVITAELFGRKDYSAVKTCVHTVLIFSAAVGVALSVAGIAICPWLLSLIHTQPEIFQDSYEYLIIYLSGYLLLILYNVCTGIFSALGDSRTPFYFLMCSSVANIFADILFVTVFRLGVPGVAWATLICQSISGILALAVVLKKVHSLEGKGEAFSFPILRRVLKVAVPSALQQSFISIGNIMIQGVINGFGTAATAGYAAAIKLNNLTVTSFTAMGNGISNFTAQNIGAGQRRRVKDGAFWGWLLCLSVGLLFTALYLLLPAKLVGIFITDGNTEALKIGVSFLRIVSPFFFAVSSKLAYDGCLRGAQQMNSFMISTMTDLVIRVSLTFILSLSMGTDGIWSSWPLGWILGALLSGLLLRRWMKSHLHLQPGK